jgi:hypothetical protein
MTITDPNLMRAAAEFTQTVISRLATKKGIHAETAISAASRMAGTFALRSCGLPIAQLAPGTPLLGSVFDGQGQKVLRSVDEALASMAVVLDPKELDYNLPHEHRPRMNLREVQSLLDEPFRAIADKYQLSAEESAHAAAVSTADLIKKCSKVLNTHLGYTIAAYGLVEASKTVPSA